MEVICKGHKFCEEHMNCDHSTPHEYIEIECDQNEYNLNICHCSVSFLREEKLKKLREENESDL